MDYYDGIYFDAGGAQQTAAGAVKGKLTSVKTATAPFVSYCNYTAFDQLGRVKASQQITDNVTYNFSDYSYNLAGALVSQTYPSGRQVRNTFDADGDLAGVASRTKATNPLRPYASNFAYTAAGAVSAMQFGNTRWETTQFNNRLQPTQIGLGTSATTQDLWQANFDYGQADNNGNVKSQTITVPNVTVGGTTYPGFTATQTYLYDSLNRLQQASESIGGALSWKQTFSYDRFGNRRFDPANSTTLLADNAIYNPNIDPNTNRLLVAEGYNYDVSGNLTRDANYRKFTYDSENKQSKVEAVDANGTVTGFIGQYVYDGDGKRIKKITQSETTIFVYDASGQLAAEYSTTAPPAPAQATTSYLTSDHLGSPRVITDSGGKVTSRRDMLPFGEDLATPQRTAQLGYSADTVRQKFATYERDIEADLDFAQARMYNFHHGRFTSPDPLLSSATIYAPQTWNRYSYALNSPYKYTDPLGLYVWNDSLGGSATDEELKKQKGGQQIIDRRNEFRNALADAAKSAGSDKLTPDQQAEVLRGVNAYGKEGEANGVTLAYGKVKDGAAAETGYSTDANGKIRAFDSDANGKVTANITVTFGKGQKLTGDTVAHEGTHIADRQDLGRAFEKALQGTDVNLQPANLPENITRYATELRAYRVSSYVNQATNTPSEVWNKGWGAVDRDKAINSLLRTNKLYKLTPENPGIRIYTEKP